MVDIEKPYGRYILEDRIAMGGMAEIFRARTRTEGFQKHVCIKRILPHFLIESGFEAMFRDEAALAARLQHGNIVQVFDFGEEEGALFLAMELVDGVDLKQLLQLAHKQDLAPNIAQSCQIAVEMCRGLHYAHQLSLSGAPMGVIHRDISPHNVLVSRSGEIKIADFGIAKAAARITQTETGAIKGKVAYMAPEQASGSAIDHRVDQFATGVVLWEMLTGERLFAREQQAQTLMAVLEANIPPPSSFHSRIPQELDAIVLQALAKDPERRFQDMRVFQQALGRFIHSLPPGLGDDDIVLWVEQVFTHLKSTKRQTQVLHPLTTETQPEEWKETEPNQTNLNPEKSASSVTFSSPSESVATAPAPMVIDNRPQSETVTLGANGLGKVFLLCTLGVIFLGLISWKMLLPQEPVKIPSDPKETRPLKPVTSPPSKTVTNQNQKPHLKKSNSNRGLKKGLVQESKKGILFVDVNESWAEVWWHNEKQGETPLKISLPQGEQMIWLKNPETDQNKKINIIINPNEEKTVRISF